MGEIADLVLEGEVCQYCLQEMGGAVGFPRSCKACKKNEPVRAANHKSDAFLSRRFPCRYCPRQLKSAEALNDHTRAVHTEHSGSKATKQRKER